MDVKAIFIPFVSVSVWCFVEIKLSGFNEVTSFPNNENERNVVVPHSVTLHLVNLVNKDFSQYCASGRLLLLPSVPYQKSLESQLM